MADVAHTPDQTRPAWLPWLMLGAIAANVFAIVTVNYWIYYARAAFIAAHPGYVAVQPPTISRAISDPSIGEPFSFWVTLSGIVLIPGVLGIAVAYARLARGLPVVARRASWLLLAGAAGVLLFQAASSVGMYMLSSYRFPQYNDAHMAGSYVFFVAQAVVIVMFVVLSAVPLRSGATIERLERTGQVGRRWLRLRTQAGCLSVGLALCYMVLFQIKAMDFGAASGTVYAAYVLAEPAVISSFLVVLAMFQTELWAVARGRAG